MGLKKFKPTSNGLRQKSIDSFEQIKTTDSVKEQKQRKRSVRHLLTTKKSKAGRNNQGRITSRFRGGGHKQLYRQIDFLRSDKAGIPATVKFIDYDPNRNCYIALVCYVDGEKRFILSTAKMQAGDKLLSGPEAPIKDGNALPLLNIPLGMQVHNIELYPGRGGKFVRAAGQSAQLVAKEKGLAAIRLPSGELRWVLDDCYATLGQLSNSDFANQTSGKAGRSRWLGRRPHNRGASMNPVDHKHGGGEGKCPVGASSPYTFAGKRHGRKTRKKRKNSSQLIISGRTR